MSEENQDYGTRSGKPFLTDQKREDEKQMSRRHFFRRMTGGAGAVAIGTIPGANPLADFAQRVDATRNSQELRLPKYSECEYTLGEDFLELRTKVESGESTDLRVEIERKNLPINESGYRPTEYEIVIDDSLNPNYNCHSFTLEQATGIEDIGADSNVWIDNPEMKKVLDTYGSVALDTNYFGEGEFRLPEDPREGDILALFDHNDELLHTGIYHTSFNGLDTSHSPYVSKFGGDKLMARSLNAVVRSYWLNLPEDQEQIKMKVYRFDESFNFQNN